MKKRFVLAFLFVILFVLSGCGMKMVEKVEDNLSEVTQQFFFGEAEKMYVTLSVGEREENYLMDGKSHPKTDFSLFSVVFQEEIDKSVIIVEILIGDKKENVEMEYNSFSNSFMADLGKRDFSNKKVSISYEGNVVELENISNRFGVDWQKAVEIGCENLEDKIKKVINTSGVDAEFYLKVLDKKANNFDNFFWCFTLLTNKNESYSVIISTVDGSVLAKTK